jgi:hypothetical protein
MFYIWDNFWMGRFVAWNVLYLKCFVFGAFVVGMFVFGTSSNWDVL